MLFKKEYFWLFLIVSLIAGCGLEQTPVDSTSRDEVFGSESGLKLYTNSFYEILPTADDITRGDAMSDYTSRNTVPDYLREGAYSASSHNTGWDWKELRNINYFIKYNNDPAVPEEVRAHYNGIARFFRAYFYFQKVKRYGDVPWIDEPLSIDDERLYAERDSRSEVMNNILEDINYAIEHISTESDPSRTMISRDVALALKSRIALFEGTFRKYHTQFGLSNTSDDWLQEAASAAKTIMDSGNYSPYTGSGTDRSYRQLFISDAPVSSEIMLAVASDVNLGARHTANWWYTSATYGVRLSFIRPFIHTYLNIDGTPFTNTTGYETMEFMDEVKGRDKRLQQTIRMGDYKRIDGGAEVPAPPAFTYTYSGYQPIKWTMDDVSVDAGARNTNTVSIFRYAEVLLNYAEAKAELGTITNADWQQTIGALRERAGITGGLATLPATADPYLQNIYFPGISDPVLLEIRRERGIELALEGFRFYDIVRWKRGELMEMEWNGFYVSLVNQYMDLNEDGNSDVYFYTTDTPPANQITGVTYVDITREEFNLSNGTSGELQRLPNISRVWDEKKYLYPIPQEHIQDNPNLGQNPGWE